MCNNDKITLLNLALTALKHFASLSQYSFNTCFTAIPNEHNLKFLRKFYNYELDDSTLF